MAEARGPAAIALCAFALAVGAALWQLPTAFHEAIRDLRGLQSETALERRFGGARRVDLDTRVFVEAERLIPADARYAVITGPNVHIGNPVALHAVAPFAGYWLLPRRRVIDPGDADWIISYGGDLDSLGLEYAQVNQVDEGIVVARVR